MNHLPAARLAIPMLAISVFLTACGGGGSGGSERTVTTTQSSSSSSTNNVLSSSSSSVSSSSSSSSSSSASADPQVWQAGVFHAESHYADRCAAPRNGISPVTGAAYRDTQGSYVDENNFLRAVSNDLYLWYNEIEDVNPATYSNVESYFQQLKTTALTPSGNAKDKFHWSQPTEVLQSNTEQGVIYGYGISWEDDQGDLVVALVEPYSVAYEAGITRGMKLQQVDDISLAALSSAQVTRLNAALFPSQENANHVFRFLTLDNQLKTITLTAADNDLYAVHQARLLQVEGSAILYGYLLFNTHHSHAELELIEAVKWLKEQDIDKLILDVRYNGGGYLDIASQLSYMISGFFSEGKVFEKMIFNDKHTSINPVTGEALVPVGFHKTTLGFSVEPGEALPTLDLSEVTIITGAGTCSASESIINALAGAGVRVTLIGDTTCGKPYGAYMIDNCGTSYFTTQFRGENNKGFGDYSDGFIPTNSVFLPSQAHIRGCKVADDFSEALGSFDEDRVNAALHYDVFKRCPAAAPAARASKGVAGSPVNLSERGNSLISDIVRSAPGLNDKLARHPQ